MIEYKKYIKHFVHRAKKITLQEAKPWLIAVAAIIFIVVVIATHSPRSGKVAFKEYSVVLTDYNGANVRFDSFKHKPIIVFFWATWCPYCNAELKHLGELKKQYGDNVQILP
jgi:cytochrome oxidase Cu insertion factor (SCO1/SenC/PrrC family)